MPNSEVSASLNHLVGASEDAGRNFKTKLFSRSLEPDAKSSLARGQRSAGICLVEVGDDDLLHLHHGLHGAIGLFAIGIAQVGIGKHRFVEGDTNAARGLGAGRGLGAPVGGGRLKVVQFWLMQAAARPSYDVTKDIVTVEWLSLAAAVKRLSHPLERLFLTNVGRYAVLRHRRRKGRKAKSAVIKAGLMRRRSTRRTA